METLSHPGASVCAGVGGGRVEVISKLRPSGPHVTTSYNSRDGSTEVLTWQPGYSPDQFAKCNVQLAQVRLLLAPYRLGPDYETRRDESERRPTTTVACWVTKKGTHSTANCAHSQLPGPARAPSYTLTRLLSSQISTYILLHIIMSPAL